MKFPNKLSKEEYDKLEARAKLEAIVYRIREINAKLIELNIKQLEDKISKENAENELQKLSEEYIELEKSYMTLQAIIYPQRQPE